MVCASVLSGRGPRSPKTANAGSGARATAPKKGIADQRATLDAGFFDDIVDDAHSRLAVFLGADGVALF